MRHIITLEKFSKPALNVGDIYITDKVWISCFMLDDEDRKNYYNDHKKIYNFVKIISTDSDKIGMPPIEVKAFFIDDEKEYFFYLYKSDLIRNANIEEKEKFNLIDNIKKYNL